MTVAEYDASYNQWRCSKCEGYLRRVFTPVALKTDTRFFQGGDDGFGGDNRSRQIFRRKCAAAGISVTGKYFPQLCRPGVSLDPHAQASDTGEIKRKLRKLGRGCEGSISVKTPEAMPQATGPYRVAEDIVDKVTDETIRKEKIRIGPKERAKLKEKVRAEITPDT